MWITIGVIPSPPDGDRPTGLAANGWLSYNREQRSCSWQVDCHEGGTPLGTDSWDNDTLDNVEEAFDHDHSVESVAPASVS